MHQSGCSLHPVPTHNVGSTVTDGRQSPEPEYQENTRTCVGVMVTFKHLYKMFHFIILSCCSVLCQISWVMLKTLQQIRLSFEWKLMQCEFLILIRSFLSFECFSNCKTPLLDFHYYLPLTSNNYQPQLNIVMHIFLAAELKNKNIRN